MRRPRTQRLVRHSRELGHLFQLRREGIEDDVEKIRQELKVMNLWIWEFDLETHLQEAKQNLTTELAAAVAYI